MNHTPSDSPLPSAGDNPHVRIWGLIPWVVNGRATAAEHQAVEAHVGDCAECRREYRFQLELHAAMQASAQADDAAALAEEKPAAAQAAFNALLTRIDTQPQRGAQSRRQAQREPAPQRRWRMALIAAVCVQAFAIAWLAGRLQLQALAPYSTLSAPAVGATPGAAVHLVVTPDMPAGELQTLLQTARLQIVGGPSVAGVLALAPHGEPQAMDDMLATLRANPHVRLAEPAGGERP